MRWTTEDQVQLEILKAAWVQFQANDHKRETRKTGAKILHIINKNVLRTLVNNEHEYDEEGQANDETLFYTEMPVLVEGEKVRGFILTLGLIENSSIAKEITDVLVRHFGAEGIRLAAQTHLEEVQ